MRVLRASLFALALVAGSVAVNGYVTEPPFWPNGSIVMQMQLGSPGGTLADGHSTWGGPVENAMVAWNAQTTNVQFTVVRNSTAFTGDNNRLNNVFFSSTVYGDSFGSAVAITLWRGIGNARTEGDVIFNTAYSWNSYRGPTRSGIYDIQRVALHELGHVLGLDHPDDYGQRVAAVMNSQVSDTDSLTADDIAGVRAIYSRGTIPPVTNRAPTAAPSCNPCVLGFGQTANISANGSDPDGDALTYQWTTTQGSFGNSVAANTTWTAPSQLATVTLTVTVRDGRGGVGTGTVALQVMGNDRLVSGGRLLPGQSIVSQGGRYRLVYQTDGNLVIYDDVARLALWGSGTSGTSAGQAVLQGDGNLVIYTAQLVPVWGSGTPGNTGSILVMQSDGNLVLYRNGLPTWSRVSGVVPRSSDTPIRLIAGS
jgi:hypothetical protein